MRGQRNRYNMVYSGAVARVLVSFVGALGLVYFVG